MGANKAERLQGELSSELLLVSSGLALPKLLGVPVKQHKAGNGQHGVGFGGDGCAVKVPALFCALSGFEGDTSNSAEQQCP